MAPETWRVVFSSTGDLARTTFELRLDNPRSPLSKRATRTLLRGLRSALDGLAVVLLPSNCRICERPLVRLARLSVCDSCIGSLERAQVGACSICGEALDMASVETQPICALFRRAHPNFDFAILLGAYDGAMRELIHLLKHEQMRPAANLLGARLAQSIAERSFTGASPVLLVPAPLHRTKRRLRRFNQSELIERSAARHLDGPRFKVHNGILRRIRPTVSQTGLTRHQRRDNVRGAFVIAKPAQLGNRTVGLVDDVYTTGTTLNECARVLRKAGARQVVGATVARVYGAQAEMKIFSGTVYAASPSLQTQEEKAAVRAVAG